MGEPYSQDAIERRLSAELDRWTYEDGHIVRRFQTGDWRRTTLLHGAIAFLAEAAFHHPDLTLSYPELIVRLRSHEADGVTDEDFELAFKIEEVATWRPAGGPAETADAREDWIG